MGTTRNVTGKLKKFDLGKGYKTPSREIIYMMPNLIRRLIGTVQGLHVFMFDDKYVWQGAEINISETQENFDKAIKSAQRLEQA